MERFFKILYYYFLGLLIFCTLYLCVVLTLSPKNDVQKRGFIPCTEKFITQVYSCERGSFSCPLKYLWKDMTCNYAVVLDGFGAWIKGNQPAPWSNYLFETPKQNQTNDISSLEKLRLLRENQQKELENIRHRQLNLDESVITSHDKIDENKIDYDIKESEEPLGDISAEVPVNKKEEEKNEQ